MKLLGAVPYSRVSDMARSLRFYVDGLGFSLEDRLEHDGVVFFARLSKDGFGIMISDRPADLINAPHVDEHHEHDDDGQHVFRGANALHDGGLDVLTYLYVENADAAYRELRLRGIDPAEAPQDKFYGVREFFVRDPDGYYFAIAQRLTVEAQP